VRQIVTGASLRVRPVMITALTAIFGLLPAAFSTAIGAQTQRPLAIVVVGGMVTTLFLTRYFDCQCFTASTAIVNRRLVGEACLTRRAASNRRRGARQSPGGVCPPGTLASSATRMRGAIMPQLKNELVHILTRRFAPKSILKKCYEIHLGCRFFQKSCHGSSRQS